VESPLLESHELGLALLPSIDDITPGRDSSVIQDPLFPQHREKGHEQCDGQTDEEDRLGFDDAGWDSGDRCQRVGSTKRGVLLQYSEEQGVCQIGGVWLECRNDLDNECGSNSRE
jgi:hypothetical protein